MTRFSRRGPYAACSLITVACVLYASYIHTRNAHFRRHISPEILLGDVIEVGTESGLFGGGCGAAVFLLAPDARARTPGAGIGMGIRDPKVHLDYSMSDVDWWRRTPYTPTGDGLTMEDRWLTGTMCADLNQDLDRAIQAALTRPGSYYRRHGAGGVIVDPMVGFVAFIFVD